MALSNRALGIKRSNIRSSLCGQAVEKLYTRRGYLVRRFCQERAIGEVGRVFPEVPAGNLPGRGCALGPGDFAYVLHYVESRGGCRGDDRLQLSLKFALHHHPAPY